VTHSPHQHFEAILFDLDATLADSRPIYDQAFAQTFREVLGIELDDLERKQYMGLPTIDFMMKYAKGEQLQRITEALTANITQLMPHVQLFAGLDEILPELHQAGMRLAVVTSQNRAECNLTRRSLGIDRWIDVWITTEDVDRVKPDPQPVLAALSSLQVTAERAVMVGDSMYDIRSGKAAGTRVAIAAWGANNLELLLALDPDYVFQTPHDLRILYKQDMDNQAGKP
jgi:HAD superfamily hydrolase (TIGR01509 family)